MNLQSLSIVCSIAPFAARGDLAGGQLRAREIPGAHIPVWAGFDWLAGRKALRVAARIVYLAPLQRHRLMSGAGITSLGRTLQS